VGHQASGSGPNAGIGAASSSAGMEDPPDDAGDVGVHRWRRALEGEARDRAGGVPADSGQPAKLVRFRGNHAIMVPHDLPRQQVEIGRAAVIAQAIPCFSDRRSWSSGQMVQ
jgi:hypothetical protein